MWLIIIIALLVVALTTFYFYVKYKMSFWRRMGVAEEPGYFPFGSQSTWDLYLQKIAITEENERPYFNHPSEKFVGIYHIFGLPKLVIRDPEIAKHVLIKDFDSFVNRNPEGFDFADPHSEKNKYFSNTLLSLKDEKWKKMRSALTPVYTSGKLKRMVDMVQRVGDECVKHLADKCDNGDEIEVRDLMRDFKYDTLASTGFGLDTNSFTDPLNGIKVNGDRLIGNTFDFKMFATFLIVQFFPKLNKLLDLPLLNTEALNYFADVVKSSIKDRKENGVQRHDLIGLIMETLDKDKESDGDGIDDKSSTTWSSHEEFETAVISNSLIMFMAGFDTSSATSSMAFYFLAKNPEVQMRLQQEIDNAIEEAGTEHLDYNDVMKMKYLDMVIHETMRAYNVGGPLERVATKDYKIPGTEIIIPKDTYVQVASPQFARDSDYYPDAEKFNPENFNAETKAKRNPITFGGFGNGPRGCIGMRFALLIVKIAIIRVLANYRVVTCSKTIEKVIPDPYSTSMMPKGSVWLSFEKRQK